MSVAGLAVEKRCAVVATRIIARTVVSTACSDLWAVLPPTVGLFTIIASFWKLVAQVKTIIAGRLLTVVAMIYTFAWPKALAFRTATKATFRHDTIFTPHLFCPAVFVNLSGFSLLLLLSLLLFNSKFRGLSRDSIPLRFLHTTVRGGSTLVLVNTSSSSQLVAVLATEKLLQTKAFSHGTIGKAEKILDRGPIQKGQNSH